MNSLGFRFRTILGLALAAGSVIAMSAAIVAQNPAPKKKVLMVWGGWDGHQPKQTVDIFAPWLVARGFDVEIANTLDAYLDADKMKSLSLIVQAFTQGQITGPQDKGLLDAV